MASRLFFLRLISVVGLLVVSPVACGDGTEADILGIGAECSSSSDCMEGQSCLSFKGGYCGVQGCDVDTDCAETSRCVTHDDGQDYCFRVCQDKSECNANRSVDLESNCSASVTFVEEGAGKKACVPPSG
ncbi:MAG: hypothetical protein KC416_15495 [Myxococcales bacterium]|nr:hypothetical protein [Myxococcales bacterium]